MHCIEKHNLNRLLFSHSYLKQHGRPGRVTRVRVLLDLRAKVVGLVLLPEREDDGEGRVDVEDGVGSCLFVDLGKQMEFTHAKHGL